MSCENHKKEIAAITNMKVLAEMIGDLHYETLADLLMHLEHKIQLDSEKDAGKGRTKLANALCQAAHSLYESSVYILSAASISKPFMLNSDMNDKGSDTTEAQ